MNHTVKIFTTPTCSYCKMAKEFFKEHGITYQEVDVTKDQVALKDMANRSGQMGVPVIDIDGQIVVGFDQERLTELLGVGA